MRDRKIEYLTIKSVIDVMDLVLLLVFLSIVKFYLNLIIVQKITHIFFLILYYQSS